MRIQEIPEKKGKMRKKMTKIKPEYNSGFSAWTGHCSFAIELIHKFKPRNLVELGVHYGDSYFAFCQGINHFDIPCFSYGIDTWEGDIHAGHYNEEVFKSVNEYNKKYSEFSVLIKSTFLEARKKFHPKSIDILHIDALHTYEAVSRDFNEWKDTLSTKGIVLLHDTSVEEFGVKKFFNEQSLIYPHFEFKHSSGLGILAVGKKVNLNLLKTLVSQFTV